MRCLSTIESLRCKCKQCEKSGNYQHFQKINNLNSKWYKRINDTGKETVYFFCLGLGINLISGITFFLIRVNNIPCCIKLEVAGVLS